MWYRIQKFPHNLIFFFFGAAYVWLIIEPHLIYNCFGNVLSDAPIFVTGWRFLKNTLGLPGGLVMYVSGFLSQGYYYSWLGTIIILLSALFICELSRRHLVAAGYARATVLSSFPAVILFLLYSRYKHPLPVSLAVSVGLLFSLIFERLPLRRFLIRAPVYCLVAAVLFWLAGTGGLCVFLVMTVIYAIFVHGDFMLPLLTLPAGFVIIWGLAQYVFLIPPRQAFLILTPVSHVAATGMKSFSRILLIILYGFVPFSVLLMLLSRKMFGRSRQNRRRRSKRRSRKKTYAADGQKKLSVTTFKGAVLFAFPIFLMLVGLYFSYDRMNKQLFLSHDFSLRKQWDKVLELGRSLPKGKSNVYFNHDVIRALYHTGRLPYDLFGFPLTPHGLFLTHEKKVSYLTQLKLCDVYLELGHVNMAEKLASEILATKNHSGIAIEKLAWVNIIKGRERTARIYLNVLKKDLIYRGTAKGLLSAIESGLAPDQAGYVDRIRSCMPAAEDSGTGKDSIEQMLMELLTRNPRNKMAFEYLMAVYLLSGQVDKIEANMERLEGLGYQTVPVLYEEAILIHLGSRGKTIDSTKLKIRPQTIQRYERFLQLSNTMQPYNRQAVLQQLIVEFGSSYFFYFTFGVVGLV